MINHRVNHGVECGAPYFRQCQMIVNFDLIRIQWEFHGISIVHGEDERRVFLGKLSRPSFRLSQYREVGEKYVRSVILNHTEPY